MGIPTYEEFKRQFANMTPEEQYNAMHQFEEYLRKCKTEFGTQYVYCVKCEAWRPKVYLSFGKEGTNTFECAVCLHQGRGEQQPYFKEGETNESSN